MAYDEIVFSDYARKRMFERRVRVAEVAEVLRGDNVIEDYEDGRYLVLGWAGTRALHVVAEDDPLAQTTTVVTVYEPDPALWKSGWRERRR
jgi:hypothetical protein